MTSRSGHGAEATVIEDTLEAIGHVPGVVRRSMDLIRKMDARIEQETKELDQEDARVHAEAAEALRAEDAPKELGAVVDAREAFAERAEKRRRCDALRVENIETAKQAEVLVARHIDLINSELAALSDHLHSTNQFEDVGTARAGDEVAIRLDDYDKEAWVVGRVVRYKADAACYDVADADDDRKVYELSEQRVVPLTDSGRGVPHAHVLCGVTSCLSPSPDGVIEPGRLQRGDEVYAVYPDTTSFYQCVVTAPARRAGAGNAVCHCQFQDDADETGVTPDRPVPLKYVLRPL